jgi:energy-coupling factor transport system permease protein
VIGYAPGHSPLHRAHPYTPLVLAVGVLFAAFAAGSAVQIAVVVLVSLLLGATGGGVRAALRRVLVVGAPVWVLLLIVHGLLGPAPHTAVGPVAFSVAGLQRAAVFGGRIVAILVAFLTALGCVSPARLVEAMTARGVPFGRMYLLVSTLTLVPRLRERAAHILEAQQCRGLRLGGSPLARLSALGPLVLPLVLGSLIEVDEQVLALDARGVRRGARRTALWPPADPPAERALRWAVFAGVAAVYVAKLAGAWS